MRPNSHVSGTPYSKSAPAQIAQQILTCRVCPYLELLYVRAMNRYRASISHPSITAAVQTVPTILRRGVCALVMMFVAARCLVSLILPLKDAHAMIAQVTRI